MSTRPPWRAPWRGLLVLLGLLLGSEGSLAAKPAPFSLQQASPLFNGPAAEAFRERRYADSARLFEAFLEQGGGSRRDEARLLAGLAWAKAGEPTRALAQLAGLPAKLPLLASFIHGQRARLLLQQKQASAALAELQQAPRGTPLDRELDVLRVRALLADGQQEQAARAVAPLLGGEGVRAEILELGAAIAEATGKAEQAASLRRELWVSQPLSQAARQLPPPARVTAAERLRRGRSLYDRHRHDEALQELGAALAAQPAPAVRCEALFLRSHTQFKARRYKKALDEVEAYLAAGCPTPADSTEKARLLYYAARSAARSGQPKVAIRFFERIVAETPASSLVDDALLLQAEVLLDQGKPAEARRALRLVVERFDKGDMLEEAWWRLAWERYRAGDRRDAARILRQALAANVRGTEYYSRGRLRYWLARIQGQIGERPAAIEGYRRVIQEEPLSYYAQLAANRLRATHPRHLTGLLAQPGPGREWTFAHRPLFDRDGFRRGILLLSLGLGDEARRELEALGLLDGTKEEELWLAAVLFERAGMPQRSHDIARRRIPGFQDHPPDATHAQQWRVAYPQPFARELQAAATEAGVPAPLLFGLMREESGFSPTVVSYAHAHGLTQLLVKTAEAMARGLQGVTVTEQSLRNPALNLRLGARYLATLLRRFHHPALAVAGYNAGGGAVSRWREQHTSLHPDELVEVIPYEQTRNYTKRVLEAYGRYRFLYGEGPERFLDLPLTFEEAKARGTRPAPGAKPDAPGKGSPAGQQGGKTKAGKTKAGKTKAEGTKAGKTKAEGTRGSKAKAHATKADGTKDTAGKARTASGRTKDTASASRAKTTGTKDTASASKARARITVDDPEDLPVRTPSRG